jgi:hypothetical protein
MPAADRAPWRRKCIVRIDFHDLVAETLGDGLELADLVVNGLIDGRRAHVKGGLHGAPYGPKTSSFKAA